MHDAAVLEIDAQISTLHASIEETEALLAEKQEALRQLLSRRKEIIRSGVILEVPPEIVGHIINLARESISQPTSRLLELTKLRLVCSQWNRIILDHQVFWQDVTLMMSSKPQWTKVLERTSVRLLETREISFDITIIAPEDAPDFLPENVVSFIHSNASRIGSLDIDLGKRFNNVMHQLFTYHYNPPPYVGIWTSMRSLRIHSCDAGVQAGLTITSLAGDDFPALREFDAGGWLQQDLVEFNLPWKQMTSITLSSFNNPLYDYFSVLTQCPHLERLSIEFNMPVDHVGNHPSWNTTQSIILPRLQFLRLQVSHPCNITTKFLNRLIVPSLSTFEFHTDISHSRRFPSELLESLKLTISRCVLLAARIEFEHKSLSLNERDLVEFLAFTPSLKTLSISAPNFPSDFLATYRAEFPSTLEHLDMTTPYSTRFDSERTFEEFWEKADFVEDEDTDEGRNKLEVTRNVVDKVVRTSSVTLAR